MANEVHEMTITGMTCGGCSGRVTRVLEGTAGVISVEVRLEPGGASVTTNGSVTVENLVGVIESAGFDAASA